MLALWVLTLKFASNLYMLRRDFRYFSDIEIQCNVNFKNVCNILQAILQILKMCARGSKVPVHPGAGSAPKPPFTQVCNVSYVRHWTWDNINMYNKR